MALGLREYLQRYGNAELRVIEKVLRDLLRANKIGVRIAAVQE